jgi:hypothetical protein
MAIGPNLPGAACRGRWDLFDGDASYTDQQTAKALCAICPCKAACQSWAEALPQTLRPEGIIAGRMMRPRLHWSCATGNKPGRPRRIQERQSMSDKPDRDAIINALAELSDEDARQVFAAARGTDTAALKIKAAAALRDYVTGSTRSD